MTISASPGQVALNGSSTITVVGRKPDGQPLNPGTEVRFSTTIGSINPIIATVQSGGVATTVFSADGRSGTATVTASTGTAGSTGSGSGGSGGSAGSGGSGGSGNTNTGPQSGIESVSVSLVVGQDASTRPSLIITANPSNIPVGGTSAVTIIARNPDRSPVGAGLTVLLTSNLGTLSPTRPVTRADGTANSTLTAGTVGGTATIGAILGTSDQATTTVTIRDAAVALGFTVLPQTVTPQGGDVTLTANVINGQGVGVSGAQVTFSTEAGTFDTATGSVFTDSNGAATVKLTLTSGQLVGRIKVTVGAKTFSGTGATLSQTFDIKVQ